MAFEAVTLDEVEARPTLVVGGVVSIFVTLSNELSGDFTYVPVGTVVVVVTRFDVVTAGTRVVEVEVVVGDVVAREARRVARWCGGVELDEAVSVKTRTKRRTGLDHITQ
ncbi:MAG: hypothetical protein WA359_05090 [Acidimicrobiales bacterium]